MTAATLTAEDKAFVARIAEDIGVGLIYADWLDEHDRPEAASFWRWAAEVGLAVYRLDNQKYKLLWAARSAKFQPSGPHNGDLPDEVFEALTAGHLSESGKSRTYLDGADPSPWLDLARAADAFTPRAT